MIDYLTEDYFPDRYWPPVFPYWPVPGFVVPTVPLVIVPGSGVSGAADTSYFIKIYDAYGNAMPDTGALWRVEVAQAVGVVGSVTFSIPGDYPEEYLRLDNLIEVYRAPRNRPPYLLFNKIFFLRRWTKIYSGGNQVWKCTAYDPGYLLASPSGQRGRVVAYAATSAQAMKTDNADDMLKAIMRENIGALATDTTRDLSSYLTIQPDTSDAPVISKEFSNRILVPVMNEICQASWTAGVYLTWDITLITPPHKGNFQLGFQTYIGQRGADHRGTSANRVSFGTDNGTLDNVEVDYDFTEEENYIRAGGQDNGTLRIYKSGGNAAAMAKSPFNRRETFVNIQNTASLTTLQHEIDWALKAGIPEPYFSGDLTVAGQSGFDEIWSYGDYLTPQANGRGFDARVDGITIAFDRDTGEDIKPFLNGYNPSPGNPIEELGGNVSGSGPGAGAHRSEIKQRAVIRGLRNSIARLQKHVQAQGRRHEYSRPYEVTSSYLLPPGNGGGGGGGGVYTPIIALFNGPCPTGWTEFTAAQGRTIVGVPAGGTLSGTVGSALANLGTVSITTVVAHIHALGALAASSESAHTHGVGTYNNASEAAHTHAAGSLDAAAEAAHTHAAGTYATDTEADHTHGVGTYNNAAEAAHTHGVGTYNNAAEAAHTHADGTLVNAAESSHTHGVGSYSGAADTAHIHSVNPPDTTSATGGSHNHGSASGNSFVTFQGGGTHHLGGTGNNIILEANTDTESAHAHQVNIAPFDSAAGTSHAHALSGSSAAGSSHNHAITGSTAAGTSHDHAISGSSAAGSSHDHALSGASAAGGSHLHDVTGSSAAGASHDHAITGSVGAGTSHDHAISGNSGAGSSHNHTLSGSVASTGSASVDVTMPYIQLRLCEKT